MSSEMLSTLKGKNLLSFGNSFILEQTCSKSADCTATRETSFVISCLDNKQDVTKLVSLF